MTLISTHLQDHTTLRQEDAFDQKKLLKLIKRSLFLHLYEQGILDEQGVRNLRRYTRLYEQSKKDIGAPRVTQSHIGSIASKFTTQTLRLEATSEATLKATECSQDIQDLVSFRTRQRALYKTHKDLITFVERLLDEPKNLLDFYSSWSLAQQKQGALVLKEFATLLRI